MAHGAREPRWLTITAMLVAALVGGAAMGLAVFDEAEHLPDGFKPCANAPPFTSNTGFPITLAVVGTLAATALVRASMRRKTSLGAALMGVAAGTAAAIASALAQGLVFHWRAAGSGIFVAFGLALVIFVGAYTGLVLLARRPGRVAARVGVWASVVGAGSSLIAGDTASFGVCLAAVLTGAGLVLLALGQRGLWLAFVQLLAATAVVARDAAVLSAQPDVVVLSPYRITSLAADDDALYFANGTDEDLFRVDKAGGEPAVVVRTPNRSSNFVFEGGRVYWVTSDGQLWVASTTGGGQPRAILHAHDGLTNIALDRDALYAMVPRTEREGDLVRLQNGVETPLAPTHGCVGITSNGAYLYEFGGTECPGLFRLKKSGGPLEAIYTDQPKLISSVIHAGDAIYLSEWNAEGGGSLLRIDAPWTAPQPVVENLASPRSVAVDGEDLYWTENGFKPGRAGKTCWSGRVAMQKGVETKVIDYGVPGGPLVVDGAYVYWVSWNENGGKSAILRARKR